MQVMYLSNCFYIGSVMRHVCDTPTGERTSIDSYDKRTNSPIVDIHELMSKYPSFVDMWELVQRAEGAVYVVSPERHLHKWPMHHLELLRADLLAAGRQPERFPVVFEVLRLDYDDPVASEEQLAGVLTWPWMDRFDTVTGSKVPREERFHERPLARLIEMIEAGRTL